MANFNGIINEPPQKTFSKFGREITDSLRTRLDMLQQASAVAETFIPKDGQSGPSLNVMIQKLDQQKQNPLEKDKCQKALDMLHELAWEQPTSVILPKTVISLLGQKISELKKAQAAMAEASY